MYKNLLLIVASCFVLSACSTTTGDPVKDRRARIANDLLAEAGKTLGQAAVQALSQAASAEIDPGNRGNALLAADSVEMNTAQGPVTGAKVGTIIEAWNRRDGDFSTLSKTAANEVEAAKG